MIRNLTIIAVASFVLAVGCFAGAAAFGGRDLAKGHWTMPMNWRVHVDEANDTFSIEPGDHLVSQDASPEISRTVAWTGADSLQLDVPAEVTFTQGPQPGMVITGPKAIVDRVIVEGGRVRLDADSGDHTLTIDDSGIRLRSDRDRLRIAITAPAVRAITLNGSGDLAIKAYDQPELALTINGSGDAVAEGKTGKLTLAIAGSGEADLSGLTVGDASIRLAGSGEAEVEATGAVVVDLAGSGDVSLLAKPSSLTTNVAGSGDVRQSW